MWPSLAWMAQAAALMVLLAAAAFDIKDRVLPNLTVLLVMVDGLAMRILLDTGWPWPSLAIWAAGILILGFLMAGRDWIGWGDAKMISAVTLLVPPSGVPDLLLAICIAGGMLSCLYIATRHALLNGVLPSQMHAAGATPTVFARVWEHECQRIRLGGPMPYGVAILGGAAYALMAR